MPSVKKGRLGSARLIFKHLIYTRAGTSIASQKKKKKDDEKRKGLPNGSVFISQISCCPSAGSSFFISLDIKLSSQDE